MCVSECVGGFATWLQGNTQLPLSLSPSLLLAFHAGLKVAIWNKRTAFTPCTVHRWALPRRTEENNQIFTFQGWAKLTDGLVRFYFLRHWNYPALQNLKEFNVSIKYSATKICRSFGHRLFVGLLTWSKTAKQVVKELPSVLSSQTVCLIIDFFWTFFFSSKNPLDQLQVTS